MDFNIVNIRKFIISSILICSSIFIEAQNNLVFNRVLNFSISSEEPVTVPEGKVWKIEGGDSMGYLSIYSSNQDYGNNINYENNIYLQNLPKPYWLGEGASIVNPTSNDENHISILEFNVVSASTGSGLGFSGGGVSSDGLVFNEALSITLTDTQILNSNARLYGEIVVPEGKILKVINVSTYTLLPVGETQSEGQGLIYIGDELFSPSFSAKTTVRFFPNGTYIVKYDGNNTINRVVINAILYSIP